MYNNKEFKTLDEQINILEHKGMVIKDREYAKNILLRENYFFINGYRHLFLKSLDDRKFIDNTTFEEVYSLFLYDRKFRNIIFKNLLIIENSIKSVIAYQLSKKYGYKETDYLKPNNFTNDKDKVKQVNDLIRKMKRQVRNNSAQHSATMHYVSNYGYIPLWVLVKVLSFGIVGEMYGVLKREDQSAIASIYGLSADELNLYLPLLANYRNLCAHEDIVYENRTHREINDTLYHSILGIAKIDGAYVYGKNDLFAVVIVMKQLLTSEEFKSMAEEINSALKTLEYNLNVISVDTVLEKMGFPENWMSLARVTRRDEN